MIFWIDAQLSPALAPWLRAQFSVEAVAVRDLGLRDAQDVEIWRRAREADVVVVTKDKDFVFMIEEHGPPPQVLWVTCGNTSNSFPKGLLERTFPSALVLLHDGEPLVEITDARRT